MENGETNAFRVGNMTQILSLLLKCYEIVELLKIVGSLKMLTFISTAYVTNHSSFFPQPFCEQITLLS